MPSDSKPSACRITNLFISSCNVIFIVSCLMFSICRDFMFPSSSFDLSILQKLTFYPTLCAFFIHLLESWIYRWDVIILWTKKMFAYDHWNVFFCGSTLQIIEVLGLSSHFYLFQTPPNNDTKFEHPFHFSSFPPIMLIISMIRLYSREVADFPPFSCYSIAWLNLWICFSAVPLSNCFELFTLKIDQLDGILPSWFPKGH